MPPVASSGPSILAGPNMDGSAVSWFDERWMFFSWAFASPGPSSPDRAVLGGETRSWSSRSDMCPVSDFSDRFDFIGDECLLSIVLAVFAAELPAPVSRCPGLDCIAWIA